MSLRYFTALSALLFAPWSAEAGVVVGRVVDPSGRPVGSARIDVVTRMFNDIGTERAGTGSQQRSAAAAADGSFRIELPSDWPVSEIVVSAAGSVRCRAADIVTGADEIDLGVVTLAPAQVLTGIVRDEGDRAVAGVTVKAVAVAGGADSLPGEAITDASGGYLMLDAPARVVQMTVVHPEYVSQAVAGVRSAWSLKRGGSIDGVVVDQRGERILNAIVRTADHVARTDASGIFKLDGLAPGVVQITASDGRGNQATSDVVVSSHAAAAATMSLRPAAVVHGTIRDVVNGRPVPWAGVRIGPGPPSGPGAQGSPPIVANAAGEFRVVGLTPGHYTVDAQRTGYLRAVKSFSVNRSAGAVPIDLLMSREGRIEGRVVDDGERAIEGARVSVTESNPLQEVARQLRARSPHASSTYSDRDGRFELRGLWPGRALRVEATAMTFVPAHVDGIELGAGTVRAGLTLVLHHGAMATGIVTDQEERPLVNVQVYSTRIDESDAMPAVAGMLTPQGLPATRTDGEGRYILSGLEQGRYFHTFVIEGYSRGFLPSTHITAGSLNELPPVRLASAAVISGRVVDQEHGPVSGAGIYAIDARLQIVTALSDAAGEFSLGNLTDGADVSLQVESDRAAPVQLKVRAPASGVTIQLSAALSLRGHVYDGGTNLPVTDFSVERLAHRPGTTTFQLGSSAARAFHAEDGAFELEKLAAGPCLLRVRAPGYVTADVSIPSLPAAEVVPVSLKRGVSVTGRVVMAGTRVPVPNVTITWRQGDASKAELEAILSALATAENAAVTDAGGRFSLEGVAPGAVTLFASHAEYAQTRANITAPVRTDVELIMNAGGTLSGVVLLDQGGPAAGATVSLTPAGERIGMAPPDLATTDEGGRFRFGRLRDGSYTVVARSPTGASAPRIVALGGAELRDDVVLTLEAGTIIRGYVRGLPVSARSNIFVMAHGEGYYDSTVTDAEGAFKLPHVPAGMVAIEATTSFRQGMTAGTRLEVVENGPPAIDVDIDFSGQSALSGIVFRSGRPSSSIAVSATPVVTDLTTRGHGETAADGSYRIDGLADGQYHVMLSGPFGIYRRTVEVRGATQFDIELPSGSIVGTVADEASHEPIAGAVVMAVSGRESTSNEATQSITDARGGYALADLDPGTYEVRATKSGYQQELRIVSVQDAEEHADLSLRPHSSISLRLLDANNGAPISRAVIRLTARDLIAFADTVALDSMGRAELPSPVPGSYVLTVLVAGYAPRSLFVQVPATSLEVRIETGGRVQVHRAAAGNLRVRLLDTAGIPQALPGSDLTGWSTISAANTVWPNVSAGVYRLESTGGAVAPVSVVAGRTSVVELK